MTLILLGKKPELYELQLLEFDKGMTLRIMEKVVPKWKQVAIALGFNGSRIEAIEMGAPWRPEDACLKMFTDWLAGGHDLRPPTWDVLIHSLRTVNLPEIADLLKLFEIVSFIMARPCMYLKRCRQWSHQVGCIRVGPSAPSPYTYFACVINFVDHPYSNDSSLHLAITFWYCRPHFIF